MTDLEQLASFNEKLLLSNGLSISPLKHADKPHARSLREVVTAIDNEKDLYEYLGAYHGKLPPWSGEPKYERHPVSTFPDLMRQ
jgi:Rho GTPase-activating protein RGD1